MYADDPGTQERDVLNRARVATQLARAIHDLSERTESAVVGLVGPWGSGKTTLIDQIGERLQEEGWLIGHHNPWSYSDLTGATAGFFSALRDAIPENVLGNEWRQTLGTWVSRVAPLGSVTALFGLDAAGPVGAVGALLQGDRSPQRLRDKAVDGLRTLQHPVLMILDDLDRLTPEELLYTFKLVRLLGRLPNIYYMLAYDEQTLTDVLSKTDLVGDPARAQQYIEKIVQVRLEIPPLLPEQRAALADACLDEICERHEITLTADDTSRIQRAWQACMIDYLDQPRSIKRLFTQVDAMWPDVAGEVDIVDFINITFLRTFERRVLDLVVENRDELLGGMRAFTLHLDKESLRDRWQRWTALIDARAARHPAELADLLAEMFMHLRSGKENMNYGSSHDEEIRRRFGVGSSEHFDRYIQIGVPQTDTPESLVRSAVGELRDGKPGDAVDRLQERMSTDMVPVLRKLSRVDEDNPINEASLLAFLGDNYLRALNQRTGMFMASPSRFIEMIAVGALDRTSAQLAHSHIQALIAKDVSSLALAADCLRRAKRDTEKEHPWYDLAAADGAEGLESLLRTLADTPLGEISDLPTFIFAYRDIVGEEKTRALMWALIDQGTWKLEEFLGTLIGLGQASNGKSSWTAMSEFSESTVDAALGIDNVLLRLAPNPALLEAARAVDYFDRKIDSDDLAPRVEYALTSIERIRQRRAAAQASGDEGGGSDQPDDAGDSH